MEEKPEDQTDTLNVKRDATKRAAVENSSTDVLATAPKKAKVESPSKVLHVRNLPPDCLESELAQLATPFGRVVKVLILKGMNQALVEMEDVIRATTLLHYYSSVPSNVRGKPIYWQFSPRQEITSSGESTSVEGIPNRILLVTILNLMYAVTIDALYEVFGKYGTVEKIIVFQKNAGYQCLIQYLTAPEATLAKQYLDGRDLYSGCCTLRVQYSTLENLTVKFNNDKSRDFTNPALPVGGSVASGTPISGASLAQPLINLGGSSGLYSGQHGPWAGSSYPTTSSAYLSYMQPNPGTSLHPHASSVLLASNLDKTVTPDELFILFGVFGDVMKIKILFNKPDTALIQFANSQQSQMALELLNGTTLRSRTLVLSFSKYSSIALPRADQKVESAELAKDYTNSPMHRYKIPGSRNFQHICAPNDTLHLSNISVNATMESLCQLFSVYGQVVNCKFFNNDKKMALIQMDSVESAVECLIKLHNYHYLDSNLRISFSKHRINS